MANFTYLQLVFAIVGCLIVSYNTIEGCTSDTDCPGMFDSTWDSYCCSNYDCCDYDDYIDEDVGYTNAIAWATGTVIAVVVGSIVGVAVCVGICIFICCKFCCEANRGSGGRVIVPPSQPVQTTVHVSGPPQQQYNPGMPPPQYGGPQPPYPAYPPPPHGQQPNPYPPPNYPKQDPAYPPSGPPPPSYT